MESTYMRYFRMLGLFVLLAFPAGLKLDAATIIYKVDKDGEKKILTKVKVISISKGVMMLEKDGGRNQFPWDSCWSIPIPT